jgi:putative ABC transport system permease protein
MLRAGARIIRADLAVRPLPTLLTGLVIAVAAGALLVTLHLRSGLDDPFDALSRATNAPDVIVAGPPAEVRRVAAGQQVARADAPLTVVSADASWSGGADRVDLVELPPPGGLDRPAPLKGRLATRPGEVVLDTGLAAAERLEPGALVTLGGVRLRVVGTAITTGRLTGGWATGEQIRALAGPKQVAVPLRLRDRDASQGFVAKAQRTASARMYFAEWQQARKDFTEDSRRMLTILSMSTLLALLASGFTLATSLGGRVIGERRRIGLLRAVGITPRGVTALLVAHYAALAAVAAPIGLLVGRLLAPGVVERAAVAIGAPQAAAPGPAQILGVYVAVLALVALATAIPAWRAGRVPPVDALALGRGGGAAHASRLARAARRLGLPVVFALGAKDAFARPARAVLTIASLVLAAVLVVCAMGFEATMDRLASDNSLRAQPWDLRIHAAALPPAAVDRALTGERDVASVARVYNPRLVTDDGTTELASRVVEPVRGRVADFGFAIPDGRGATAAGEATFGRGALDALGVRIGDTVRLRAGGAPFSVRVVGRHVEPDDDGRAAVLPASGLPAGFHELDDPFWVAQVRPGADPKAVQAALTRAGDGQLFVERPIEELQGEAADTRPFVYGVTALLLIIAGANLLTTLLLGVRERRRDVAVLGAVGASPAQVGGTVIAGASLLTALAAIAGLPLGGLVFRTMIRTTDPADGPDVVAMPSVVWVLLAVPVALAVTAAVSSLAARQAARVPVATALRAE